MPYKVGDKIKFVEEKKPYTIKACNERYLVCTKPFNLKHTVLYTIVDLQEGIRGTNWFVFNIYNYMVDSDCKQCLEELISGECEISHRNCIKLNIEKINTKISKKKYKFDYIKQMADKWAKDVKKDKWTLLMTPYGIRLPFTGTKNGDLVIIPATDFYGEPITDMKDWLKQREEYCEELAEQYKNDILS